VNTLGGSIGQEVFNHLTAVDRGAIPDQDHVTGHLAQQMFQEGHHIDRVERVVLAGEIQLPLRRQGADGREMVARPPLPQDRRLPDRGIGADHTRQGVEPRFVYEEEVLPLRLGPLLMTGQVSSRHWIIAASSRWRARRAGFWGLQRISWHKRPTCTGW
jgi:hypothetical protein